MSDWRRCSFFQQNSYFYNQNENKKKKTFPITILSTSMTCQVVVDDENEAIECQRT